MNNWLNNLDRQTAVQPKFRGAYFIYLAQLTSPSQLAWK